jgi:hypothetical protein
MHFGVLFIEEYRYSEKTFHRNVKFFPVREIRHQRISSRMGKYPRARPKLFVYIRVANSGDFPSPKKANFRILIKNVLGIL